MCKEPVFAEGERWCLDALASRTGETDGKLPSGEPLREALERVDADADSAAACFAVNYAHPSYFDSCFDGSGPWTMPIRGIRANVSARSHAELDIGHPSDLSDRCVRLCAPLPALNVVGVCCGADFRHLRAIRDAWPR